MESPAAVSVPPPASTASTRAPDRGAEKPEEPEPDPTSSSLLPPPRTRRMPRSSSFFWDEASTVCPPEFDVDVPLRWYKRLWTLVLWLGGLFDMFAYAAPFLRSSSAVGGVCRANQEVQELEGLFLDFDTTVFDNNTPARPYVWFCSTWGIFLDRLQDYTIVISFVFSLLWFKNTHAKARENYYTATLQHDRRQLLLSSTKENTKTLHPSTVFYRRILVGTSLLPVGFYIIVYQFLQGLWTGQWRLRELLIPSGPEEETVVFFTVQDPTDFVKYEISTERAKMSTAVALLHYWYQWYLAVTLLSRRTVRDYVTTHAPHLRRQLVGTAVRQPRQFYRHGMNLVKYLRWLKYSAPLIAKVNKLRGRISSTVRKRRQYALAKQQERILQDDLCTKKSTSETEENATILIQRVWRAYQNQLYNRAVAMFSTDQQLVSALKIQLAYRRTRLSRKYRKRRELYLLEKERTATSSTLNDDERRRLYELQDEFMNEAKNTINKKLLMRPNTKLNVAWNYLFIVCILVEISQHAIRPWLKVPRMKKNKKRTGTPQPQYTTMRSFLAESLIPTPVSETIECKALLQKSPRIKPLFDHIIRSIGYLNERNHQYDTYNKNNNNNNDKIVWMCTEPVATYRDGFRDIVALALSPKPISQWSQCNIRKSGAFIDSLNYLFRSNKRKLQPAWYCSKPYVSIHNFYRSVWNFLIDEIKIVIAIVCFLDVFVKLFTGEIDAKTGELHSKPFLKRWIYPGLFFQLLANPAIGTFSTVFFQIMEYILFVGPVRAIRWYIAVIIPIIYASKHLIIKAMQESESDKQLVGWVMLWEYSS